MRYLITLLLASPAYAATTATVTTQPTFDLYQGAALVSPRVTRGTFAECVEAGRALNKGDGCQSRNGKFKRTTVADPPVTPPVNPMTWPKASDEDRSFTVHAATRVAFCAVKGPCSTTIKTFTAGQSVSCAWDQWLPDPEPNVGGKTCRVENPAALVAPVPPTPVLGTASLTWTAPTQNTDGSAITGTLTYRVYRGTSPTALTLVATVTVRSYAFSQLASGTHYFAVAAVSAAGTESAKSAAVSKAIP